MAEKGEDDVELFVYDGSVHPNTIIQKEKTGGGGWGVGASFLCTGLFSIYARL